MTVTEQWLPMEHAFDKALIDMMVREKRRFVTGLRYNLPSTRPLACIVACDTTPHPTAMYIVPPGVSNEYNVALNELVEQSKLASWVWRAGAAGMPALPHGHPPDEYLAALPRKGNTASPVRRRSFFLTS